MEEQLKKLYIGTRMGISTFEQLEEKIKDKKLKNEFHKLIEKLYTHEKILKRHLQYSMDEIEHKSIKERMIEKISMVKNMMVNQDEEVIEEALKNIEKGQQAIDTFRKQNESMEEVVRKDLTIIKDDYMVIYHKLKKLQK